ncbi:MAG: NCS2 family permease [Planctomycetota bacterium]|nr:MAG: NCS2 family permease [Planctomycetota bacterium]
MRWFVRGDVDGFFGLALDNLVQLLLIDSFCRLVLGFPAELVYGRVLPGVAVSLLVGNLFYARQAMKLARQSGRSDVCALPYGINTVSLIGHVFLVMLPAKLAAEAAGHPDPAMVAWRAGLLACVGSGLIECGGALVADRIRKATPRAALLATLSGIALGFISLGFVFRVFERPIVGFATLAIVMAVYFGKASLRLPSALGGWRLPGGLVAVILGAGLAWMLGYAPVGESPSPAGFCPPVPVLADLGEVIWSGEWLRYLSVILPMGVANVVGSLQNIESAEAAGDPFPTRPSLLINGLGTMAAALFGSCFPTTIYIGHPGWKGMGARAGYSVLNGVFMTLVCLTGTVSYLVWAVPVDAGAAILIWIAVIITAQAFQATPRHHAPAAAMGLLPGVAAWGVLLLKSGFRTGVQLSAGPDQAREKLASLDFDSQILPAFHQLDLWVHGAFALEQGFIFTSMILAACAVAVIEGRFRVAAAWCAVAAGLSLSGLIHGYRWAGGDTVIALGPAWPWFWGYGLMAAIFWVVPWLRAAAENQDS